MNQATQRDGKLDQLTSLRFFAALMIVIHHAAPMMGASTLGINWGQGVSFFFVLSGFILTYVYPQLDTLSDTRRFLRARVARIWPAHFVALLLGFAMVPYTFDAATAAANVLLVHAWIPKSAYYFSYNGVSWSVSTEMFFYLAFPLLIFGWRSNWVAKFVAACLGLAAWFWLVDQLALPDYGSPLGDEKRLVTQHGLIYIHPVTRIFEFILGMVAATLWRRHARPLGSWPASSVEIAALLLCGLSMAYGNRIASLAQQQFENSALTLWLVHSGSLFSFAALIVAMANGGGIVSRALTWPALVLAGEISFSMYLLHEMMLQVLGRNMSFMSNVPSPMLALGYLSLLMAASYLMWVWVEVPGRRMLLGGRQVHGTPAMKKHWSQHLGAGRGAVVAGALVVMLAGAFQYTIRTHPGLVRSDQASAEAMTPDRFRSLVDASFGDFVRIAGANIVCDGSSLTLSLVWQKLGERPGVHSSAVHFVDAAGNILGQVDYPFPKGVPGLDIEGYWTDGTSVARHKIDPAAVSVAIGVYDAAGVLLISPHPNTDWDGRRLLLPLGACRTPGP